MSLQASGSFDHKIIPSLLRTNMTWLNVVLNLNGILCICQETRHMPKDQAYMDGSRPHSSTISYLVGTKVVYVRSFYERLFRELGNVVDITIWNSMKVATIKSICEFLFKDLSIKPINILGQESCKVIKIRDTHGKM